MALSKEEIKIVTDLKAKSQTPVYDDDIIRYKEIIKQHLLGNSDSDNPLDIERTENNSKNIIHFLNNTKLDEEERDSYLGINILPYYILNNKTDSTVKNYICYEEMKMYFLQMDQIFLKMLESYFM